jgi:hypothetical protein
VITEQDIADAQKAADQAVREAVEVKAQAARIEPPLSTEQALQVAAAEIRAGNALERARLLRERFDADAAAAAARAEAKTAHAKDLARMVKEQAADDDTIAAAAAAYQDAAAVLVDVVRARDKRLQQRAETLRGWGLKLADGEQDDVGVVAGGAVRLAGRWCLRFDVAVVKAFLDKRVELARLGRRRGFGPSLDWRVAGLLDGLPDLPPAADLPRPLVARTPPIQGAPIFGYDRSGLLVNLRDLDLKGMSDHERDELHRANMWASHRVQTTGGR